jgi:predicted  nucleic acid-binding Zn-ribbon protein
MALPALTLEWEAPLEERVARLETNVEHIQKDVADMKIDIRRLGEKIDGVDQKLCAKIDSVDQKLTAKIDGVDQKLSGRIDSVKDAVTTLAINMEKQFANVEKSFAAVEKSFGVLHTARAFDRVWWLLMSGALLGLMARAFKWI